MHLLDTRLPKSGGFPLCYQLLFAFQSFLEKEINLASRKNTTLNLILADVDSFKYFNDTYGHQTGDFILKE